MTRSLDFPFTPVPRRVLKALEARKLSRDEFAILAWLWFRRPDHYGRTVSATLQQITDGISWDLTDDWLRKRLRTLRAGGWLSYETSRAHAAPWHFRLYATDEELEAAGQSHESPMRKDGISPMREDVVTLADRAIAAALGRDQSHEERGPESRGSDMSGPADPMREDVPIPDADGDSAPDGPGPNPMSLEAREEPSGEGGTTALAEGEVLEGEPSNEAAVLAEVQELVAEGVLEERGGPCRYVSHRPSDWRNDGGRLVCGVCHPPVRRPLTASVAEIAADVNRLIPPRRSA